MPAVYAPMATPVFWPQSTPRSNAKSKSKLSMLAKGPTVKTCPDGKNVQIKPNNQTRKPSSRLTSNFSKDHLLNKEQNIPLSEVSTAVPNSGNSAFLSSGRQSDLGDSGKSQQLSPTQTVASESEIAGPPRSALSNGAVMNPEANSKMNGSVLKNHLKSSLSSSALKFKPGSRRKSSPHQENTDDRQTPCSGPGRVASIKTPLTKPAGPKFKNKKVYRVNGEDVPRYQGELQSGRILKNPVPTGGLYKNRSSTFANGVKSFSQGLRVDKTDYMPPLKREQDDDQKNRLSSSLTRRRSSQESVVSDLNRRSTTRALVSPRCTTMSQQGRPTWDYPALVSPCRAIAKSVLRVSKAHKPEYNETDFDDQNLHPRNRKRASVWLFQQYQSRFYDKEIIQSTVMIKCTHCGHVNLKLPEETLKAQKGRQVCGTCARSFDATKARVLGKKFFEKKIG